MLISSWFTTILLVVTIVSPSCSNKQSSDSNAWSIDFKSSGGFAGGGNGNVTVESTGQVTYQKPRPQPAQAACQQTLSKKDLTDLSAVVAQTKPEGWKVDGLNVAAPDALGYDLVLMKGKQSYNVKWFDNTVGKLPDDLSRLAGVLSKLKESQSSKCR